MVTDPHKMTAQNKSTAIRRFLEAECGNTTQTIEKEGTKFKVLYKLALAKIIIRMIKITE